MKRCWVLIKFKYKKLKAEWENVKLRSDVKDVITTLAFHMKYNYGIDLIVTSIFPEAGIERVSQTHKAGRAVDIRTRDWQSDLPFLMEERLNEFFSTGAYHENGDPMKVCVYHDSGYGKHFHIQGARWQDISVNSGVAI